MFNKNTLASLVFVGCLFVTISLCENDAEKEEHLSKTHNHHDHHHHDHHHRHHHKQRDLENELNEPNQQHHKSQQYRHHNHHHHHKHGHSKKKANNNINVKLPRRMPLANDDYFKLRKSRVINLPDNWDRIPFIFQTYNEPTNYYQMPVLSNGFIGTTVKNDSLYLNGMYKGAKERSHRLRIPSITAVEASLLPDDPVSYHFDCRRGIYTIETKNSEAILTQRFYVHRRMRNLIITEIKVELLVNKPVVIYLHNVTQLELDYQYIDSELNPNKYSYFKQRYNPENISFEQRVIKHPTLVPKFAELNDGVYHLTQAIMDTELPMKRQKQVHMVYTNIPDKIYVNTTNKVFHFIQSVDTEFNRAKSAYDDAINNINNDQNSLYVSHMAAWEDIWTSNGFLMVADSNFGDANSHTFKLAQRLYSSFYNIYSSIPYMSTSDVQFYGLSPGGLAYGGLRSEYFNISSQQQVTNRPVSEAYGGHVMYHQELWILPLVSMFSYDMSERIIQSRLRRGFNTNEISVYQQALENARAEGRNGLRYPWEQADFGIDVSPYEDARKGKIHTSADISFGVRSYLRMSHSRDFLSRPVVASESSARGEELIKEIALYWSDRMKWDQTSSRYEIEEVSFGERSQSRLVDNEGFTNVMAGEALETCRYILELNDRNPFDSTNAPITQDYENKQNRLKLPYDSARQLYLEYDGFTVGNQNQETWIPYLNYPIQRLFNFPQKKAIYETYANQLQNDGANTLSYSSFIVGHLEMNEERKAKDYYDRFVSHFSAPFHVMSEYPQQISSLVNPANTFNYLPGYAAFIQTFIAGFSGIRQRDFQLDIVYPSTDYLGYTTPIVSTNGDIFKQPVENMDSWNITGLTYRGNKLDFVYNLRSKSVEIRNRRPANGGSGDDSLEVLVYEGTEPQVKTLRVGESVMLSLSKDQWYYKPKKSRLQYNNGYTENMHILASIYSKNYARFLRRASHAATLNKMAPWSVLLLSFIGRKLVKYLSQ